MRNTAITLVFLCMGMLLFSQNEQRFEQGKTAYNEGNFEEAVTHWETILYNGEHSTSLYYNLGNAHFKLQEVGPSIYYYEKALQLDPNDSDVLNNLAFAQNLTIDAIDNIPKTLFERWYVNISGVLSFNGWAWTTVIFTMGFSLLFMWYYFSRTVIMKRTLFILSFVCLGLALGSLSFAYMTYNDAMDNDTAIVFSERSQVRSEPLMRSTVSFAIHEGTKVNILEVEGDWARIELSDGKDGWLPLSDIRKL